MNDSQFDEERSDWRFSIEPCSRRKASWNLCLSGFLVLLLLCRRLHRYFFVILFLGSRMAKGCWTADLCEGRALLFAHINHPIATREAELCSAPSTAWRADIFSKRSPLEGAAMPSFFIFTTIAPASSHSHPHRGRHVLVAKIAGAAAVVFLLQPPPRRPWQRPSRACSSFSFSSAADRSW